MYISVKAISGPVEESLLVRSYKSLKSRVSLGLRGVPDMHTYICTRALAQSQTRNSLMASEHDVGPVKESANEIILTLCPGFCSGRCQRPKLLLKNEKRSQDFLDTVTDRNYLS